MFSSDKFAFETPNVIDPGDLPPSRPKRNNKQQEPEKKKKPSRPQSSSSDHDYQEARQSAARLLHDIGDLDLTPPKVEDAYDPYHDDEQDDDDGGDAEDGAPRHHHHSLPSVEEARMYATALLSESEKLRSPDRRSLSAFKDFRSHSPAGTDSTMSAASVITPPASPHLSSPYGRTIKLSPRRPNKGSGCCRHRPVLNRLASSVGIRPCIVVVLLIVVIAISATLLAKNNNGDNYSNGDKAFDLASIKTQRHRDIVNFLSANGVSTFDDLTTPGMPQYIAANWIADVDPLERDVPPRGKMALSDDTRLVQRYVLATFFFATKGIDWKHSYNFMTSDHECAWFRTTKVETFLNEEYATGVDCDDDLRVTGIFLPKNNLVGDLPDELGFLPRLNMLAAPHNFLTGPLPEGLGSLTNLIYLDLKYNTLTGPIPDWISDLGELEVLGLSNNHLVGTLPDAVGDLVRLKTLAIDDNGLTGDVGAVAGRLTNLEYFYADRNRLTGNVDDDFLADLLELRELDLSGNNLTTSTTSLPAHLFRHPTLHTLDMGDNNLRGIIPELSSEGFVSSSENLVLKYLSLRDNKLSGALPDTLWKLRRLAHLDLEGNDLTGYFDDDGGAGNLGKMTEMQHLFLGDNTNFFGGGSSSFPLFLSKMVNLKELSLRSTGLTGAVPGWMNMLQRLQYLDLSHNNLQYAVPDEVWDLPDLTYLMLHDNRLSGVVPLRLEGYKLKVLSLHRNSFSGDVDHVCDSAPELALITTDCDTAVRCSEACCPECCETSKPNCFEDDIARYLIDQEGYWEFGYARTYYSFDPAILVESQVVSVIQP